MILTSAMAFYKVICVATLLTLLTLLTQESHSQLDVCGWPTLNTEIVGGQEPSPGSWPWLVSLQDRGLHLCGGSLINKQWVLTSALCCAVTDTNNLTVVLGLQNQQGSNPNHVSRTVTQIIYPAEIFDDDICLVELSSPVNFTHYIQPICLAAQGSTFYNGTVAWLNIWGDIEEETGLPGNLTESELLILGNRQCNCDYAKGLLPSNMMCAGLNAGGENSNQLDIGGPLVSKQGGHWIQDGIVGFINLLILGNFPALFTRVSQYQSWINNQTTSNQPGFITFTSTGTDSDLSVSCAPTTTQAPTTLTKTTQAPTTLTKTTQAPTTLTKTTQAPTTLTKTTQAPTALTKTTQAPTALPTTTQAPTALTTTTQAPPTLSTTTQAPSTLSKTTQAPTALPTTTQAPTTLTTTTQAPTTLTTTTQASTTLPTTTQAPTALPTTTQAPTALPTTTQAPTALSKTTQAPAALPTTTQAPTTLTTTTQASTTLPTTTQAPTALPTTTQAPTALPTTTQAPTTLTSTALAPTTTSPLLVCGHAPLNSCILGGSTLTTAGVWPWMASLRNNRSHVCGGTLVALDFVLSNANCFSSIPIPSEWTVVLGRLNQNGSNPFEVTLNVKNITLSNFTGSNVAVLRLETRPTLSNNVQPICLDNGRTFRVGSTCWAAGWSAGQGGAEQVLQEFQTSLVDCGNASTSDSICTSSFTLVQGDSGGPMMCKQGGSWFQAAVLSVENNSSSQTRADPVMVFTKLSRFQSFLAQTVGMFLSPASNTTSTNSNTSTTATNIPTTSGGAPAQSPFFFFLHLLIFSVCLHIFL